MSDALIVIRLDHVLAAESGMLCGLIDIFLVGTSGNESTIGKASDKWINECMEKFSKMDDRNPDKYKSSPIAYLEWLFKVPYDQKGAVTRGYKYLI